MKLLLDMNLSPDWVAMFGPASIEAVHWSSVGLATAPDFEIMEYARIHGYVVLTHDLDFGILLALGRGGKPSVVQIRMRDVYPEVIGQQVVAALRLMETELEAGALVTLGPQRTRVRSLPFGSSD
jgi:predicted nuclease of predicted toxin-antitoxin system